MVQVQMLTRLEVADNSGAEIAMCIKPVGGTGKHHAGLGDEIVVSIKKAKSNGKVKAGSVQRAVIVRVTEFQRKDGSTVRFDKNAVVLIDKNHEPIGTRVFGPMPRELRRNFAKILSLAPEVL